MKTSLIIGIVGAALAGCSGSSEEGAQYNDVATGARLMRENPIGRAAPEDRVARLAECAGTLQTSARQTPPPERAESLLRTADRLFAAAVGLGASRGQSEADVARIRDETIAANQQLARTQPQQFARLIEQGANACDLGSVMTDEELTG